jgi:hypothetical protein
LIQHQVGPFHRPAEVSDRGSARLSRSLPAVSEFTQSTFWPRSSRALHRVDGGTDRQVDEATIGLVAGVQRELGPWTIGRLDAVPELAEKDIWLVDGVFGV